MDESPVYATAARVFLDTQVITLFKFLDDPDKFIPEGEDVVMFMITLPVVRELERIKNEHYSKGQRGRARRCLELLEEAEHPLGKKLSERSYIYFKWQEPNEAGLRYGGLSSPQTPDDHFIAAVYGSVQYSHDPKFVTYVMSDDLGVRVRTKHFFRGDKVVAIKPPDLRHADENLELPRLVQDTVRALAKEIAAALRG
jgi:hypothetical protein